MLAAALLFDLRHDCQTNYSFEVSNYDVCVQATAKAGLESQCLST